MDELKSRGILRSRNNPVADLSEYLISRSLGLTLENNSKVGYDAIDQQGIRYQIKGRVTKSQLGIIRNLGEKQFDFLMGVIFDPKYEVSHAAKIPHSAIKEYARFNEHQNGHILTLGKTIREDKRIESITNKLDYQLF